MKFRSVLVAGIAALFVSQPGWIWAQSSRLDVVKSRGTLLCGVNPSFAGFSLPDSTGQWHGFDVDICRAVAAAVFGDAGKVKYVALSAKERFTALQSGDVDVLARNATWTLTRNVQLGVNFIGTNFYDGQAFMVKADSKIKSVGDLDGASICAISGADTERNLSDYFRSHGMKFKSVSFENADNVAQAYFAGRCDAIINDRSQLASLRSLAPDPKEHIVLPEIISTEPLSPSVRAGDDQWANVVRWSFYAMVQAEDLGLQSTTVRATISTSQNPNVLRFAGKIEDLGGMLGLDREWAVRIVEQVGNYGESYERNIKPIGLDRGINRLWKDGGIIIAPPIR
ncbi:MAG: amino acid ABC transporter substrate-binding protein [Alphaproteobacteria bacterium]|nr:MAG: amino acid ABC transporter substrate-binding protein [Alphaproteobacteria bacterium]